MKEVRGEREKGKKSAGNEERVIWRRGGTKTCGKSKMVRRTSESISSRGSCLPLLHTDCLTWPSVRLDGDMEGLEFTGACCGRLPPPTPPLGSFGSRALLSSTTEYITFFKLESLD